MGKPSVLRMSADPTIDPDVLERAISGLSGGDESPLAQAAREGLPEPADVAEWVDRCKRLVLVERERSSLRSEVPALAQRLIELLNAVCPSGNCEQQAIVEAFLPRLPEIRALARRRRRRRVRRRPRRAQLRARSSRLSRRSARSRPPDRARALPARRADRCRASCPSTRTSGPASTSIPARTDRPALLHRSRHRRRDRRDRPRSATDVKHVPGRHARRALAAPRPSRCAARSAIRRSRTTSRSTPAPRSSAATP